MIAHFLNFNLFGKAKGGKKYLIGLLYGNMDKLYKFSNFYALFKGSRNASLAAKKLVLIMTNTKSRLILQENS
jgi:hypothetical protein